VSSAGNTRELTTLRHRLGVVVCVFLALVTFASGLSALMLRSWDRSLTSRSAARNAAIDVSDLRTAYSDQETGVRGFLLTSDITFLEPYRAANTIERTLLARLHDVELSRAGLLDARLDLVEAAADRWVSDVVDVALDPESVPPDEDMARTRFDALRAALDDVDRAVTDELRAVENRSNRLKGSTFGVLIASSIAALVATAVVAGLFRRWVTHPLEVAATYARRLAADERASPPTFDSAELRDVADAIEGLQASLATERDRAVTALIGLEQSAVLALHVRSELSNDIGELPGGWAVATSLLPAEGVVAGDCFDMGLLDQTHLYLVLIDVTGHGARAALDALRAKAQLRAGLRARMAPGAALAWLSRENRQDEHAELLTAFVCVVDITTGACTYANAGHPGPLLIHSGEIHELARTGPLVGAFDAEWTTETTLIRPTSTLIAYSDGVTDAVGLDRQRFGEERLRIAATSAVDGDATRIVEAITSSIAAFAVGDRVDDATIIALRRDPVVAEPNDDRIGPIRVPT
jgi:serine phosphatase RsbU (regulator of sigma subunit)/CHASE3 domain sensor protein